MQENSLARGLGWFGILFGLAEFLMPQRMGNLMAVSGRTRMLRLFGLREIATGIGILSQQKQAPWIWARVAGDVMDLMLFSSGFKQGRRLRTLLNLAGIAFIGTLDLRCGRKLNQLER
jgi:hypothetical protein